MSPAETQGQGDDRSRSEGQTSKESEADAGLVIASRILTIASIVLGILAFGLLASLVTIMGMVGIPLAPLALMLGIAAVIVARKRGKGGTYAVVGCAVGLLSTILAVIVLLALLDMRARIKERHFPQKTPAPPMNES